MKRGRVRRIAGRALAFVGAPVNLHHMLRTTSQSARRRRTAAFSLLEVIVGLAVILIIAAVALPTLTGYLDQQNVVSTATKMTTVADALTGSTSSFYKATGRNSSRLSMLSTVIVQSNAGYLDSCGAQFTKASNVTDWTGSGPFVNFVIERTTGLVTPIGVARDTLTRIPNSATTGNLRVNFIDGVETRYAELLDSYVDSGNGNGTGTVQWTLPAVNGLVVMYYFIPVNNKC
jgi:type II secretory pathway pseudopilin PulG